MKPLLFAFVLLLAVVPAWAEEVEAQAEASPEPSIVEATTCLTSSAVPTIALETGTIPFLGASETTPSPRVPVCVACRELVPTCHSPGQDAGKACGDGDPPNTCTCKWCGNKFGCFP